MTSHRIDKQGRQAIDHRLFAHIYHINVRVVGITGTLEQILFGPTSVTDGSQNIIGALRTTMGICGAPTVQDMHKVEVVIAPAITTEGKSWQHSQ